jgi:Ca2+:H+ antiporter
LLIPATITLLLPALFDYTERGLFAAHDAAAMDERLSLVYLANLVYTFRTHRDVFAFDEKPTDAEGAQPWPLWQGAAVLVVATAVTAWEAELVSGAMEESASRLGLSPFFLGVVVLAVVGNAEEYVAAIYFARKDKMGLAISITVGSTIQVALLLAPVLVLVSHFMGHPMNLVFQNPLELNSIAGATFAVNFIAGDGETCGLCHPRDGLSAWDVEWARLSLCNRCS